MSSPYADATRDDGAECKRCHGPLAGDNTYNTCFKCRGQVAGTILQQLGGPKIGFMLGTKKFYSEESGLIFSFKGNRKMNKCRITLTWDDLYTMDFFLVRAPFTDIDPVETHEGLYYDMLVDVFEGATGLYLSL